jgi:C-terminal processing protease CtpA/Prc
VAGARAALAEIELITVGLFRRISSLSDYASAYTAMSVTIGDVIMKDGSRIEGAGVIPDEAICPTGFGLTHKTDPLLAFAAARLNAKITPEQAGQFHFITDKQEDEDEAETEARR